jgi:hypothetical protein
MPGVSAFDHTTASTPTTLLEPVVPAAEPIQSNEDQSKLGESATITRSADSSPGYHHETLSNIVAQDARLSSEARNRLATGVLQEWAKAEESVQHQNHPKHFSFISNPDTNGSVTFQVPKAAENISERRKLTQADLGHIYNVERGYGDDHSKSVVHSTIDGSLTRLEDRNARTSPTGGT